MQPNFKPRAVASAIILWLSIGMTACNDAEALSSIPADQLFSATSLTSAERKQQIRGLNWRLSTLAAASSRNKSRKPFEELIEELCECVVDNLQDRTTRLQFSMAIDAIKNGGFQAKLDVARYRSVAAARGMSNAEFEQQTKEIYRHLQAVGSLCLSRFAGRH